MTIGPTKYKSLWTHADFETMGWHDCPIYGIRFENEVLLDIDYIFEWNLDKEKRHYSFLVAPATLVFHEPSNLKIDIKLEFVKGLEIAIINRTELNNTQSTWSIETQEAELISSQDNMSTQKDELEHAAEFIAKQTNAGRARHNAEYRHFDICRTLCK